MDCLSCYGEGCKHCEGVKQSNTVVTPISIAWYPMDLAPKGGGAESVKDPNFIDPPKILLCFGDEAISVAYWDWYYASGGSAWVEPCSGELLSNYYQPPTGWIPLPFQPKK